MQMTLEQLLFSSKAQQGKGFELVNSTGIVTVRIKTI